MCRFVRIHFLNLSDGSPYRTPPAKTIVWGFPQGIDGIFIEELAITGSRIMMYVHCWEEAGSGDLELWIIFVWDWRTGDLVRPLGYQKSPIAHLTSSGARLPIRRRESIGWTIR